MKRHESWKQNCPVDQYQAILAGLMGDISNAREGINVSTSLERAETKAEQLFELINFIKANPHAWPEEKSTELTLNISRELLPKITTSGTSLWSKAIKQVTITGIRLIPSRYNKKYGELQVIFDVGTWNILVDGLIYTDKQFLSMLKIFLTSQSIDCSDLDYSEQGMQSHDYVSFDVGEKFIRSYKRCYKKLF